MIGIAVLGAIDAGISAIAPHAPLSAHKVAATNGVSAAYWTGAAVMVAMAVIAFVCVRRRTTGPGDP